MFIEELTASLLDSVSISIPIFMYLTQMLTLLLLVLLYLRKPNDVRRLQTDEKSTTTEDITCQNFEQQTETLPTESTPYSPKFSSYIPLIEFIFGKFTKPEDMIELLNDDVTRNLVSEHLITLSRKELISIRSVHGREEIIIGIEGACGGLSMGCGGLSNQPAAKTVAIQLATSLELVPALAERRHDLELQCADLPCIVEIGGYIRKSSPKNKHRSNFPMEVLNVHLQGSSHQKLNTFRFHAYRWK
jgi:hypothetical protein